MHYFLGGKIMTNRDYYFIKPYDETLAKPPKESFGQILNETYLHPFDWNARTTRKSYWWSVLVNAVLAILALILFGYAIGSDINLGLKWVDGIIAIVVYVYVFLSGLGQTIRRLHDVNYSGYWYWLSFVPYGSLFILYLSLQPSAQKIVKWGTYLFADNEVYREIEEKTVPEPKVSQIIKEHFFDCFNWNARSTRTSYWVGTAISKVISVVGTLLFYLIVMIFGLAFQAPDVSPLTGMPTAMLIVIIFFAIILLALTIWALLAQLGHTVRRLHDGGFNGWWCWIGVIPYVGEILLAALLFHPTVDHEVKWNKYLFNKDEIK